MSSINTFLNINVLRLSEYTSLFEENELEDPLK